MPTDQLIPLIKRHEGSVTNSQGRHIVYDDATGQPVSKTAPLQGNPTLGFGSNLLATRPSPELIELMLQENFGKVEEAQQDDALQDVLTNTGISDRLADLLLQDDVATITQQLQAQVPLFRQLDPVRQDAMIDLAFNVGVRGILQFTDMWAALGKGQFAEAADAIRDSTITPSRANDLAKIVRTGQPLLGPVGAQTQDAKPDPVPATPPRDVTQSTLRPEFPDVNLPSSRSGEIQQNDLQ